MKIVYFRVGWMKNYNGLYKDSIQHGGSYNKDNIGHEIYNFQNIDNKYYGFVQVIHDGSINIARIGEPTTDKYIEDVLVVFVAKDGYNGQKIVGWYLNSTVFKDRMYLKDEQLVNREYKHINVYRAVSKQAVLLDVKDRTFIINGLGQSNIWYGDNDTNLKVYKYIYNYSKKRGISMKLYKLSQGSTFENLKHFIYLTNEYGVPSSEFVDDFIDQFGRIILNDNFTITQNQIKQLDELWGAIVKDCTNNNIEYKENYSNIFYTVLSKKALNKIKEGWEQSEWNQLNEQDRLELLKQFITDFDNHIQDGIDMQELYFENTPELIEKDKNGDEYIKIHINEADRGLCTARLYRDSTTIIEIGSCIGGITQTAIDRPSLYNRIIEARNGKVHNNIVTSEIVCKSPSGAGQVYRGFTCNGWVSWYNDRGELIDTYREKSVTNVYNNISLDEDAARIHALINQSNKSQCNLPKYKYKLTDDIYIGKQLTITESADGNESTYKAKVLDKVNIQLINNGYAVNINKFIEEVESRNSELTIRMGFFKFEDIYMEEK